jgi:hypothetical protein
MEKSSIPAVYYISISPGYPYRINEQLSCKGFCGVKIYIPATGLYALEEIVKI